MARGENPDQQRQRLLDSAIGEIGKVGTMGLRILDVARDSKCSVTTIYRLFGDREGLVANALLEIYRRALDRFMASCSAQLSSSPSITIEDFVDSLYSLGRPTGVNPSWAQLHLAIGGLGKNDVSREFGNLDRQFHREVASRLNAIASSLGVNESRDIAALSRLVTASTLAPVSERALPSGVRLGDRRHRELLVDVIRRYLA